MPGDRELAATGKLAPLRVDGPTWDAISEAATRVGLKMPEPVEH
jgi:hypothetical protein